MLGKELPLSEHLLSELIFCPLPPHSPTLLARFYGEPFVPFPWVDLRFLPFLMVTSNLVLSVQLGHSQGLVRGCHSSLLS